MHVITEHSTNAEKEMARQKILDWMAIHHPMANLLNYAICRELTDYLHGLSMQVSIDMVRVWVNSWCQGRGK